MIDMVRSSYGYQDEYILDKTFLWLTSSIELISRREYEDRRSLAGMIAYEVGNLFAKKGKAKPLPSFDDLVSRNEKKFGNHDENFMVDSIDFLSKPPNK